MEAKLEIKRSNDKNEIMLNGISLTDRCLSCDIHIRSGHDIAELVLLCDSVGFEGDPVEVSVRDINEKYSAESPD